MAPNRTKIALVFRGRGADLSGYRSATFLRGLAAAGIDPIVIDVTDTPAPGATAGSTLACAERDFPEALHAAGPALVQTFGHESQFGPIWRAAVRSSRPALHFVQTAPARRIGGAFRRALAGRLSPSRHVAGVLGPSRVAISRAIGLFPRAVFSRVIPPPVEPSAPLPVSDASPRVTFGIYDPFGTDEMLRFVLQAVASSGHTDLFNMKVGFPAYRIPPVLPRNVTAAEPIDPVAFVGSVDALILPYDAEHLVAPLLAALQAGKPVIVPDGGVASELIGFGRSGVLFADGSAYDLALKINIVTGSSKAAMPFEYRGGEAAVRACAPDAVARAFAAAFRFALAPPTGA